MMKQEVDFFLIAYQNVWNRILEHYDGAMLEWALRLCAIVEWALEVVLKFYTTHVNGYDLHECRNCFFH